MWPKIRPWRTSNCQCVGHWRNLMRRWVVLHRARVSKLQCNQCRWKWRSTCGYVRLLPNWKPEIRSGMKDRDILARLRDGSLTVNMHTAEVKSWVDNSGKKTDKARVLKPVERQPEGCGGPYRFVHISRRGKQKKIALHRLVWMAHTMRLIPKGYDVDHVRSASHGDDGLSNLRLRLSAHNRATNGTPAV